MTEVSWATGKTRQILEVLSESSVALSMRGLELNLELRDAEVSYSTVKNHIKLAKNTGLVETVDEKGNWYQITDAGREWLKSVD